MDLFESFLSFTLAAFAMAAMPGPDNIYVITESLNKGFRTGAWIAFGLNSGVLLHTLAAASGLSLILLQSDLAFQLIQYAGAVYLVYLAYGAFKEKVISIDDSISSNPVLSGNFRLWRRGFIMNILNPKVSLFFIALLPQFLVKESAMAFSLQMSLMGVIFMLAGLITFISLAAMAHQLRGVLSSPLFWKITKVLKIIVLLGIAGFLLLDV